jgi:hypothetical protein
VTARITAVGNKIPKLSLTNLAASFEAEYSLHESKKRKNRCNNALRKESLVDFAHEREKMESS